MNIFPGRILAQSRPSSTSATSAYAIAAHNRAEIRKIVVSNTSLNPATFRIFHDEDGTTYDETTSLFWDIPIDNGETVSLEEHFWMDGRKSGNFAVRSSASNALTFTVYGAEEKVK
tara:strand:+ start:149 stop:496 length:348 start_codon:yes stop_codon:yes gene_type:complete